MDNETFLLKIQVTEWTTFACYTVKAVAMKVFNEDLDYLSCVIKTFCYRFERLKEILSRAAHFLMEVELFVTDFINCIPKKMTIMLHKLNWIYFKLGPPWFNYWFSFTLAYSKISAECSCLFIKVINFLCLRFDALTELGAFMRTEFNPAPLRPWWITLLTVLRWWPRCCSYFFVALWFIPRGDLFDVLPCVIFFLCFSVLLALRLPRLGKKELILVLFVRFFDLRLFGFVCFLFLLVSGKGCSLWLWHSLDFSLSLFT